MPAALNLAGSRYGKLTVVSRGPAQISKSGKSSRGTWHCLCDCGRQELIVDCRIPHCKSNADRSDAVYACEHCRSIRVCEHCCKPFSSVFYRTSCSDICRQELKRACDREFKRKLTVTVPGYYKQSNIKRRERLACDPDFLARHNLAERERSKKKLERQRTDPAYAEYCLAQARARYALNAAEVQARRKQRRAEMTPARIEAIDDRAREIGRKWREKWRATPEGARISRENGVQQRRRANLGSLLATGAALQKRMTDDETED